MTSSGGLQVLLDRVIAKVDRAERIGGEQVWKDK